MGREALYIPIHAYSCMAKHDGDNMNDANINLPPRDICIKDPNVESLFRRVAEYEKERRKELKKSSFKIWRNKINDAINTTIFHCFNDSYINRLSYSIYKYIPEQWGHNYRLWVKTIMSDDKKAIVDYRIPTFQDRSSMRVSILRVVFIDEIENKAHFEALKRFAKSQPTELPYDNLTIAIFARKAGEMLRGKGSEYVYVNYSAELCLMRFFEIWKNFISAKISGILRRYGHYIKHTVIATNSLLTFLIDLEKWGNSSIHQIAVNTISRLTYFVFAIKIQYNKIFEKIVDAMKEYSAKHYNKLMERMFRSPTIKVFKQLMTIKNTIDLIEEQFTHTHKPPPRLVFD